jgi:hypothetical protein
MNIDPLITQNTGHIPPATENHTGADIELVESRARAATDALSKGSAKNDASGAGLLIDALVESVLPGGKLISAGVQFLSERHQDKMEMNAPAAAGTAPRTMDESIKDSFKSPGKSGPASVGEKIVMGVNAVGAALSNRAAGDTVTAEFHGGGKKGNATNIPADKNAAANLTRGVQEANVMRNHHQIALNSALMQKSQHAAAMGMARGLAPGMDLSSGPKFRAQDIVARAREVQKEDNGDWRGG